MPSKNISFDFLYKKCCKEKSKPINLKKRERKKQKMFVRVKSTPNSPRQSVQIAESVRDGERVKQKIVRHVGIALDEDELMRLKDLAEYIKAKLEQETEPSLFPAETMAEMAIESRGRKEEVPDSVKLKEVEAVQDVITGIHDVYGEVFTQIGFGEAIARPASHKNAQNKLFHVVMGRIADPGSKRSAVRKLESDFGVSFSLDSVYRMMDLLDEKSVKRINAMALESAEKLLKEKINVVFYDCTTLYFESFTSDDLKENGYSKDLKFNQAQVLLALMVTTEGLPLGYEVFPGSTFEGNTLKTMIEKLQGAYEIGQVTFVADSAMFSAENLNYLDARGIKYIVSCRVRNQPKETAAKLQDLTAYREFETGKKIREIELDGKRIIAVYSSKRAAKDAKERLETIERLRKKLSKSKKALSLMNNYGCKRFLKFDGESTISLDEEKIKSASKFDGIHAVITNDLTMKIEDAVGHYHGLWQIEECFRISKHDLRIRPVFHWTPARIRAHIAICFMALSCVRHLSYRLKLQYGPISPERIKDALLTSKLTIVRNKPDRKLYAIPSNASPDAVKMYKLFGKTYSRTPFHVTVSK